MATKPKRDLTVEEQLARGPLDLPFLMLVLLLTGIGLIMVFSTTPPGTSSGRPSLPRRGWSSCT